ncbi:gp44 [Brochothrix phage BL3]|uniref:Mu Gam-like end protection n=1 Tax=Brochothrix phage BL3 TaxID=764562 RepID=UPI0001D9ADD5|nr:Mu Gam-like end protection [Brochothrix phage BL3]ADH03125.1 gp44 [Brochothrix phage BL3]
MTENKLPQYTEPQANVLFEINSDSEVSRAVDYINWAEYQKEKNTKMYEESIAPFIENIKKADKWLEEQNGRLETNVNTVTTNLKVYLMRDNQKRVESGKKARKTVKTPFGNFSLKKQQPQFVKEEKLLMEYAQASGKVNEKTTVSIDWAAIKKESQLVDGKLIDPNGEVVPGVKVVEQDDKATVTLNKGVEE